MILTVCANGCRSNSISTFLLLGTHMDTALTEAAEKSVPYLTYFSAHSLFVFWTFMTENME